MKCRQQLTAGRQRNWLQAGVIGDFIALRVPLVGWKSNVNTVLGRRTPDATALAGSNGGYRRFEAWRWTPASRSVFASANNDFARSNEAGGSRFQRAIRPIFILWIAAAVNCGQLLPSPVSADRRFVRRL